MNEDEISIEAIKCNTKNMNIPSNHLDLDRGPSMVGKSVHATGLSQQLAGNTITKHHCIMQKEI